MASKTPRPIARATTSAASDPNSETLKILSVSGRAPGQPGLWLDYGHAHWGLTLGPASGRLIAEMITGAALFCDPTPYAAERFAA